MAVVRLEVLAMQEMVERLAEVLGQLLDRGDLPLVLAAPLLALLGLVVVLLGLLVLELALKGLVILVRAVQRLRPGAMLCRTISRLTRR